MMSPEVIIIEACDFHSYPVGGQLAFSKQLLHIFGNKLALVGVSTDNTPVGIWVDKEIDGIVYKYFSVQKVSVSATKRPIIPSRILHYFALKQYLKEIMKLGVRNVFTQSAQSMLAIKNEKWDSICYCFPSVKNEIEFSRYRWARLFKSPYEKALFRALQNADVILAAADNEAIQSMIGRSNGMLNKFKVTSCPTCSNSSIFHPCDQLSVRSELRLDSHKKILLSCGKLMYIKGWKLLLESFSFIERDDVQLIFVGDGEDKDELLSMAAVLGVSDKILLTGILSPNEVAKYMNAADLFLVGSLQEGWSVAMVEALSSGLPIVSTNVSGANDLIRDGVNGFIVHTRDPYDYSRAIMRALELANPAATSLEIAEEYNLDRLPVKLAQAWHPFA